MHGCRYRNWSESWEASGAPLGDESLIKPIYIPLEALIPQEVDNLLIGGKSIAATHIVNGSTRVHYGEWVVGGAAGATAGWLVTQAPDQLPVNITQMQLMGQLQNHLISQGLRLQW
jgi:hypothetical protein